MKNNFKAEGEIIYIELNRRDGSKLYTLIDLDDLEMLMELDVKWHGYWDKITKSFYVRASITIDGKRKALQLHRFLMNLDFGDKRQIDHIKHNTLDNRRSEIRIVTSQQNQFNRKVKGYCWHKGSKKFIARIKANGKRKHLGYFNTELEAQNAYLKAKEKYHKIEGVK